MFMQKVQKCGHIMRSARRDRYKKFYQLGCQKIGMAFNAHRKLSSIYSLTFRILHGVIQIFIDLTDLLIGCQK